MTTLLLAVVCLLLLGGLGLAVRVGLACLAAEHHRRRVRAEALATEIELQKLTRQAMQRLLDEARRAQAQPWQ